ncbi:unnamed protein product [Paramecium pentaurelia]|uniref:Uncharacterized protein n=1 Tax=Paramecium pentaurelia TaxID=43138 RepID=A0A8S1VHP3_9CILI|nr:unnamed protein product [Paramecium pentaurelia]
MLSLLVQIEGLIDSMNIINKLFLIIQSVTLTILNQKFRTIFNHKVAQQLKLIIKMCQILKKLYLIFNHQKNSSNHYFSQVQLNNKDLFSCLIYYQRNSYFQFSEIEQINEINLFSQGNEKRINTKGLKFKIKQNNPIYKFISISNKAIENQIEFDSLDNFFFVIQLKDEYILIYLLAIITSQNNKLSFYQTQVLNHNKQYYYLLFDQYYTQSCDLQFFYNYILQINILLFESYFQFNFPQYYLYLIQLFKEFLKTFWKPFKKKITFVKLPQ